MLSINKKIKDFIIPNESSIQDALQKINTTKHQVIFVVDSGNTLLGSFSDGDFRRHILQKEKIDSNQVISEVMNKNFISLPSYSDSNLIIRTLNKKINSIPLLNKLGQIESIAELLPASIHVGEYQLSEESPVFIIAEIGNNHQGDVNIAKSLVDKAKEAGADCVKFQMRNMDSLYGSQLINNPASEDLGSQYTLNLLSKYQLTNEDLLKVFDYAYEKNILPLCTAWDVPSLEVLEDYGMEAYKVASADFTNKELLNSIITTGKPMFCSTGMSNENEISTIVKFLNEKGAKFVLLHCNSTYPTPFKDVNLSYLHTLKGYTQNFVGYSGHERGISVPIAAVALGAKVIEKHFTLDKTQEGNDHKVSLLPLEFKLMVEQIRQVEQALIPKALRTLSQGEMLNKQTLGKSLFLKKSLKAGEKILNEHLGVKSPGTGMYSSRIDEVINKTLLSDVLKGSILHESHIFALKDKQKSYNFLRPYGIPVRYHDYAALTEATDLDFIEFHLSHDDLKLNPEDFISKERSVNMGFAVHTPELFEEDHIIDLASYNDKYRGVSVNNLRKVIETTLQLGKFFPSTNRPVIVLNAGGWTEESFLNDSERQNKYDLVKDSLDQLSSYNALVNISIQTMPPFPWHFGGQRFHNLFVNPDEIDSFCSKTGHRVCLDISHSMMACNYYGWPINEFIKKIGKYSDHIHISDSEGEDGEGVQMGKGEVEFFSLINNLNEFLPNVPFIPEVWQGHHNNGQGFWSALSFLENLEF